MSTPTQIPAGWYDDGSGAQRWWDGQQWTDAPVVAPAAGTPAPSASKTFAIVALIVGGVAFLLGLVPVLGVLLGATAILFGLLALRAHQPKVLSIIGIALGGVAALTSIIATIGLVVLPPSLSPAALPGIATSQSAEAPVPDDSITEQPTAEEPVADEPTSEPSASAEPEVAPEPDPEPAEDEEPELSVGQQNAVDKASSYLDFLAFSRSGLVKQLKFEGFHTSEAKFAVDYLDVNWNKQAAEKAQSYLDISSFSRQGLIDQLRFEGFTAKQAKYGAKAVGY